MDNQRFKLLIDYLGTLGSLEGNYFREINGVIKTIEAEFGINQERVISEPIKVHNFKYRPTRANQYFNNKR